MKVGFAGGIKMEEDKKIRERNICENAAELMLQYGDLVKSGEVYRIDDERIDSCELICTIANLAIEFEDKYGDTEDWINDIFEFSQEELVKRYGIDK